ncbi:MAG TPA: hypothetical protein VKB50_08345 [Vicinamibacterales bacterium]|nr:hypothetical protein [Vicinamibacterales bacterium]
MRPWFSAAVLTSCLVLAAPCAQAQSARTDAEQASAAAGPSPVWSLRATAAVYVVPDEGNYVQPTVAADRDALHLEARYNYEGRHSLSGFAGWNVEFGKALTLQLTPMFGVVAGDTDGIIPALEVSLAWRRLALYSEGEYVIDLASRADRYLYNWSEASVSVTGWLRAGFATQRTRAYNTPRDIQRGPLVGVNVSNIEATLYVFNPGSDERVVVTAIGVKF